MTEEERLCNVLYSLLFAEETRLQYEVENAFSILKLLPSDMHYIEKYKQTVQRYEDFKTFSKKVTEVLKRF